MTGEELAADLREQARRDETARLTRALVGETNIARLMAESRFTECDESHQCPDCHNCVDACTCPDRDIDPT